MHPVIWPIHPRTRKVLGLQRLAYLTKHALCLIEPVSYLDMLLLEKAAKVLLTDSGGCKRRRIG